MATLFSDFLTALGVKHTEDYSDKRFQDMPFQSMFGLANLLKEYGVGTEGIEVDEKSRMDALPRLKLPFLIDTADGFAIILSVSQGRVTYMSQHKEFNASLPEIIDAWNGVALIANADKMSIEPSYEKHNIAEKAKSVKKFALSLLVIALLGYAMWTSHLYADWAAWPLLFLDIAGLWLSWSLVQKSLGIHTKAADAVCSTLEEGGCDEIAQSEAASFMGIFKWSEVGFSYFSVSLLSMLLFPQTLPALAAINILCLPYTIWSITYQKFIAKTWCTLCVCVQATLWLLFVFYLLGGYVKLAWPINIDFWVLCCSYGAVLLGLNRLDNALSKYFKAKENGNS